MVKSSEQGRGYHEKTGGANGHFHITSTRVFISSNCPQIGHSPKHGEKVYTGDHPPVERQAFIRFETIPGLQGQVDWADFQVIQPTGQVLTYYLFIMVLGFSRAIYAELVKTCTMQTFMDAHIRAFKYLGGVPMEILYDNLKHVVIDRKKSKANFNIEFLHFAHHYAFKPVARCCFVGYSCGREKRFFSGLAKTGNRVSGTAPP